LKTLERARIVADFAAAAVDGHDAARRNLRNDPRDITAAGRLNANEIADLKSRHLKSLLKE
jgi:hypothetical protein